MHLANHPSDVLHGGGKWGGGGGLGGGLGRAELAGEERQSLAHGGHALQQGEIGSDVCTHSQGWNLRCLTSKTIQATPTYMYNSSTV